MSENRCRLARERAGLSVGQAAKLLGVTQDELRCLEVPALPLRRYHEIAEKLADAYGVNLEWLAGERERYDYEALKQIKGAEDLTFHDRDTIAEFAASMRKPSKTLAEIARKAKP